MVEVASVLLLNSKTVGIIVPRLDGVLCYTGDSIIPGRINLIDAVPELSAAVDPQNSWRPYQCIVVSMAN